MAKQRYRRKKRKTLGRFLLKFMFLTFMCLALIMGATVFFKVETISVEGNGHYTAEEVIAATNIQIGENLFTIQRNFIEQNITYNLPYIQSIEIKLNLPSGIKLVVQEQIGMVQLITDQEIWYMGVQGKLLELATPSLFSDVPQEEPYYEEWIPEGWEPEEETGENPEEWQGEWQEEEWQDDTLEEAPILFESEEIQSIISTLSEETIPFVLETPWDDTPEEPQTFTPPDMVVAVTGINPVDPHPGTQIQVAPEDEIKLEALLNLFKELEAQGIFSDVTNININKFNYLEFDFKNRFLVKLSFQGDFSYKLRSLMAAVEDTEDYETGVMDLTQESYAVLFSPD